MSTGDLNLSTIELTSTLITAPLNGAPSSADYNDCQRANLVDLSTIVSFINNQVLPLVNALSAAALLPSQSPVGIQGSTIWTDTSDQGSLFFDSLSSTPLTIYESFNILNGIITTNSQQLIDLGVEVAALQSLLASTDQNDISLALQNLTSALDQLVANLDLNTVSLTGVQAEINTLEQEVTALQENQNSTGLADVLTTAGDTIYSSSGSIPARLGIGTNGYVLTVVNGLPAWEPATGGGGSGASFYACSIFEGDPTLTQPVSNQVLCVNQVLGSAFITSITLPVGLAGSVAGCRVASTGSVTITIKQNGTSIGTINFAASATTATFTFTNQVVLNPSDTLSFIFQSVADATIAGIWWTIGGSVIAPGGGGGGGGSTTLASDTDVSISSPINGQVLTYDVSLEQWINAAPTGGGGGSSTLAGDTDVDITSPTTGQILTYNGTVWVNQNLGSGSNALADDSDVHLTSPSNKQVLTYNGTDWINQTPLLASDSDVTISAPSSGQFLKYNGSHWVNATPALANDSDVTLSSPLTGQVLTYNGSHWVNLPPNTAIGINNQTANYTLALTDINALVRMNVSSANTVTVPPFSSVAFAVGDTVSVRQVGVGTTTIAAGLGVTITTPGTLILSSQYATAQLINVGTNLWDLVGDTT